jgi:hypothetical protein
MTQTADMTVRRRNAAIKKVLQHRFGNVPISVRGTGVLGHCIRCNIGAPLAFAQWEPMECELVRMIEAAGIRLNYYGHETDMGTQLSYPAILFYWDDPVPVSDNA